MVLLNKGQKVPNMFRQLAHDGDRARRRRRRTGTQSGEVTRADGDADGRRWAAHWYGGGDKGTSTDTRRRPANIAGPSGGNRRREQPERGRRCRRCPARGIAAPHGDAASPRCAGNADLGGVGWDGKNRNAVTDEALLAYAWNTDPAPAICNQIVAACGSARRTGRRDTWQVAPYTISREDMCSIRPDQTGEEGTWLSGTIIDAFSRMLLEDGRARGGRNATISRDEAGGLFHITSWHMYNELTGGTATGYDFAKVRNYSRAIDVTKCARIVIPIHKDGRHWVAVLVDGTTGRIDLLDPYHHKPYTTRTGRVHKHRATVARRCLRAPNRAPGTDRAHTVYAHSMEEGPRKVKNPEQHNSSDCGIFFFFFNLR